MRGYNQHVNRLHFGKVLACAQCICSMDPDYPHAYGHVFNAGAYNQHPAITVTNYAPVNPATASFGRSSQARPSLGPREFSQEEHTSVLSGNSELDSSTLPELTVKMIEKGSSGGKNYVLKNVVVGNILNSSLFKQYLGEEFVDKVGESPEELEIGYFKGNKRIWMHTSHEYSDVLEKLCSGCKLTLWCEYGRTRSKVPNKRAADVDDSDDECARASKSVKRHKMDEKKKRVQDIFEELKSQHKDKYTGPVVVQQPHHKDYRHTRVIHL